MKDILNVSLTADTWTEVTLASAPIAQYAMWLRSPTAVLKFCYSSTNQDSKYCTIRAGGAWTDSLTSTIVDKKIWVNSSETTVLEVEMTLRGGSA